jgi:hypothetical protein
MGRKPNRTYYLCHLPLLLALKLQSSSPGNECGNGSVRQIDKALYFDDYEFRSNGFIKFIFEDAQSLNLSCHIPQPPRGQASIFALPTYCQLEDTLLTAS